jgi:SAM-dependent methyltransferase
MKSDAAADQEKAFIEKEADAWFDRNFATPPTAVGEDDPLLRALREVPLPPSGSMLDVGGGPGHLSAGFLRGHPTWSCRVVEPSTRAIAAGRAAFPALEFVAGSVAGKTSLAEKPTDLVIVSGVLSWVDRRLLSLAVANLDGALADGGLLAIADFDAPYLRANPYHHRPGLHTYKQDYASIFSSLGTYHCLYRRSQTLEGHTSSDSGDAYDRQWVVTVLRKDLRGRYLRQGPV